MQCRNRVDNVVVVGGEAESRVFFLFLADGAVVCPRADSYDVLLKVVMRRGKT